VGEPSALSGPELAGGAPVASVQDGVPLLGHAHGEPVILTCFAASTMPGPSSGRRPRYVARPRIRRAVQPSGECLSAVGLDLRDGAAGLSPDRESPWIGERRRAHSVASGTATGGHAVAGYQRGVGTSG